MDQIRTSIYLNSKDRNILEDIQSKTGKKVNRIIREALYIYDRKMKGDIY